MEDITSDKSIASLLTFLRHAESDPQELTELAVLLARFRDRLRQHCTDAKVLEHMTAALFHLMKAKFAMDIRLFKASTGAEGLIKQRELEDVQKHAADAIDLMARDCQGRASQTEIDAFLSDTQRFGVELVEPVDPQL